MSGTSNLNICEQMVCEELYYKNPFYSGVQTYSGLAGDNALVANKSLIKITKAAGGAAGQETVQITVPDDTEAHVYLSEIASQAFGWKVFKSTGGGGSINYINVSFNLKTGTWVERVIFVELYKKHSAF